MVPYSFHTDRHGDSVTVLVYAGPKSGDAELLVNGKEVAFGQLDPSNVCEMESELPTSPPTPVTPRSNGPGGAHSQSASCS